MMRLLGLLLVFWLLIVGCKQKNKETIAFDKMKVVLWDVLNADNFYIQRNMNDIVSLQKHGNLALYDTVFALHEITKEQFYYNYQYYEMHPMEMRTLIDSVEAYGTRKKAGLLKVATKPIAPAAVVPVP